MTYSALKERWLSGQHVGAWRPAVRAYVRSTRIGRNFWRVPPSDIFAHIPGLQSKGVGSRQIYRGRWLPATEWKALPNVLSFRGEHTFEAEGIQTATIDIDNIGMVEESGVLGVYHLIKRGYYAPFRGFKPWGRPAVEQMNEWFGLLKEKSTEIMVVAGYGDAVTPVFDGLINDVDLTSRPDRITITARDVGQLFSDQAVFMSAKIRGIRDPITFADRRSADKKTLVGRSARASASAPGHGARFILDRSNATSWRSRDRDNKRPSGNLPWVQIAIPNGRYETFDLKPEFRDLECYVAIRARDKNAPGGQGAVRHISREKLGDGQWIDEGRGNVPGTNIPMVRKIERVQPKKRNYRLPDWGYRLGDDSQLRLYFTNLDRGKSMTGRGRAYRAGVQQLRAVRREMRAEARKERWILVDDLADVVRLVFQWCGVNDWEIESTGVRLKEKSVWNRGHTLMDIIRDAAEQVGYVCYIKPPDSFDESPAGLADQSPQLSMGVGVFRQNQAMRRQDQSLTPVEFVSEDTLLQGIQARVTDEPLAHHIRVRGAEAKKKEGGRFLGADRTRRHMYVYRPPWARDIWVEDVHAGNPDKSSPSGGAVLRNANIKKQVVHHDPKLDSVEECKIAALFIAFREALESAQATVEFPAMPTIHLDDQLGIYDTGTGLSTRIWVATRQLEYMSGPRGHFKMSVGGSLLNTPDIQLVRQELQRALRNSNYNPGIPDWEKDNVIRV